MAAISEDCSKDATLHASIEDIVQSVLHVIDKISGPYAFVFFDDIHKLLFYGRDVLGRRSLLQRISENHLLELTSVSDGQYGFQEVKADGVYILDVSAPRDSGIHKCLDPEDLHRRMRHVSWEKESQAGKQTRRLVSISSVSWSRAESSRFTPFLLQTTRLNHQPSDSAINLQKSSR